MTPALVQALVKALETNGWTVRTTPGTGHITRTGRGEERGDGTRPRTVIEVPCTSYGVQARHPDGRRVVAVFASSTTTPKGKPSWKLDQAWRGRHPGEHAPVQLGATDLAAYVTGELGEVAAA